MPSATGRRHHQDFATVPESLRRDRYLLLHAGCRPLAVEGRVRRPDECVDNERRLGRLDLANRGAELGNVKRKELAGNDAGAIVGSDLSCPFFRELTEIVVSSQNVNCFAVLLDHVRQQMGQQLARRVARAKAVTVADPALIRRVVEEQRVGAVKDRPDHLARRAL